MLHTRSRNAPSRTGTGALQNEWGRRRKRRMTAAVYIPRGFCYIHPLDPLGALFDGHRAPLAAIPEAPDGPRAGTETGPRGAHWCMKLEALVIVTLGALFGLLWEASRGPSSRPGRPEGSLKSVSSRPRSYATAVSQLLGRTWGFRSNPDMSRATHARHFTRPTCHM